MLKKAVSDASVVYHCIGMPYMKWASDLPPIMDALIEAAAANGPETTVVYIDNLYACGKDGALEGPLTERTPQLARGKKGRVRKDLAARLLAAGSEGILRPVILQASDFFGPGATNSILDIFVFKNALAGKKAAMFTNPDARHSYAYLPDIARAAVRAAGPNPPADDRAVGRAWVVPHCWSGTTRELLTSIFRAAGVDPAGKIGTTPRAMLYLGAPFVPIVRELIEVAYQQYIDWVADGSEFTETFGLEATPVETAIERTLAWYRGEHPGGQSRQP
jgi:nucleoside-diphosphate-sugar epimerase